jgi:hypothetical protein
LWERLELFLIVDIVTEHIVVFGLHFLIIILIIMLMLLIFIIFKLIINAQNGMPFLLMTGLVLGIIMIEYILELGLCLIDIELVGVEGGEMFR